MSLFKKIKELIFKTQPVVVRRLSPYSSAITSAAASGDIANFDKYYAMSDPEEVNHYEPLAKSVWNGHLDMYKHMINLPTFQEHQYVKDIQQGNFVSACLRGHLDIVKYMMSPEFPLKFDFDERHGQAFLEAARSDQKEVIDYFLNELNYIIYPELRVSLEAKPTEDPHPPHVSDEIINYALSQERYLKMQDTLGVKEAPARRNKI